MLRVRKEQLAAFEALSRCRFEDELALHLRNELPDAAAELGDGGLRQIVTWAIERGRHYGFITERQVCLFASAALLLAPDFETALEHRWAKRILDDPEHPYPDRKLDALYEAIAEHLDEDGDDNDNEEDGD